MESYCDKDNALRGRTITDWLQHLTGICGTSHGLCVHVDYFVARARGDCMKYNWLRRSP